MPAQQQPATDALSDVAAPAFVIAAATANRCQRPDLIIAPRRAIYIYTVRG